MFLPMSWMSPSTVAMTIGNSLLCDADDCVFALASRNTSKADLAASADAMSWGRKMRPSS